MLLVQQFLIKHSLKELQEHHGVYCSFSKSGHKASFNYDQIEAKESDPLSQECRGLILSAVDGHSFLSEAVKINGKLNYDNIVMGETIILSFPMRRFFNYGQSSAVNINWSDPNLAILEKLDGSCIFLYYDHFIKKWCVATRSVPEADLLMDNGIFTFRTLFEKAVKDTLGVNIEQLFAELNEEFTYSFELTTPYNRIVVNYPNNRITLLAARSLKTLNEVDPNTVIFKSGVPIVQAHTYTSINELVDWVSSLNPTEHEGVVVRDRNFNRIKIKNAAYVAASKLRDSLSTSPKNCLELILLGKDDDASSLLPEDIRNNLFIIKENFVSWLYNQEQLAKTIIAEAASISSDKKTFALTVQKHKPSIQAALFSIYDGKSNSVKNFIENNRKNGTWSSNFLDKLLSVI